MTGIKTLPLRHIEIIMGMVTLLDLDGNGYDCFEIDEERPWEAVAQLVRWSEVCDLDAVHALKQLRRYLKACR